MLIVMQGFKIQTENHGYWKTLADSLTTDLMSIPAERGNIYSADDRLLATSLPFFEVRVDFASPAMTDEIFNENVHGLSNKMAEHFGKKTASEYRRELINARKNKKRYHLIKRNLNYAELKELKTWPLFNRGKYKGGLIVISHQKRKNPYDLLANRTIGYVRDNAQDVGLESQFDEYLSGKEGHRLMQKIAGGTWIPLTDENAVDPQNGRDVVTTIDVNLQDVAQYALYSAMQKHDAAHGCVVVMEVETGAIKAIANLGKTGEGRFSENYNYAVGKSTEPGSTFKLASMLAMFEDGYLSLDDSVDVHNGRTVFYSEEMYDAGNWNKYREISAKKVFSISSNVGTSKFAHSAYNNNAEKFYNKLKQFHLTEKTGIGIKGEAEPLIRTVDKWSKLSVPWISIGYEIQLTPLQTLNFYNTVANGGKMMKPYLVKEVMSHGKVVKKFDPIVVDKQICKSAAIKDATEMLVSVVEGGTARKIRSEHYTIAGKTGTAKLLDAQHGYVNRYQASFAGFFPAEEPKYSCIVVIVGPSKGLSHGGEVAAPVFKEIADKVMSADLSMHLAINHQGRDTLTSNKLSLEATVYDTRNILKFLGKSMPEGTNSDFLSTDIEGEQIAYKEKKIEEKVVPNVKGMNIDDALFYLENKGCKVIFKGTGKVVKQSISPGSALLAGQTVYLELS